MSEEQPKRQYYSEEFRKQAVEFVCRHKLSLAEAARRLGVNNCTLSYWVRLFKASTQAQEPHPSDFVKDQYSMHFEEKVEKSEYTSPETEAMRRHRHKEESELRFLRAENEQLKQEKALVRDALKVLICDL